MGGGKSSDKSFDSEFTINFEVFQASSTDRLKGLVRIPTIFARCILDFCFFFPFTVPTCASFVGGGGCNVEHAT